MILETVEHFKNGDVVVFPTDTVYGIGCDVRREESIRRVCKIRKDTAEKPTLILASGKEQAFEYGVFGKSEKKFVGGFWPGPLTIIVRARDKTPAIIQGKNQTIGIRVPNQPPIIEILKRLRAPVIAPSANFHGEKAPTSFNEIDKDILALVDYAINLGLLKNGFEMAGKPSTLVDLSSTPVRVIRTGSISKHKVASQWEGASK
jgi:L-threonylcarbamoyladenylate synthase